MHVTDRRRRLRDYLQREGCIRPASVFDPVSSRTAYALGFEVGMLGGSIASAVILGAPDVAVMTLTELADQVRRITRASDISQMIDADNGYGNALNVMRTVRELEDAGASGMTIEDTSLPSRYGAGGKEELIPLDEMTGKLRAAVAARQDDATVILGRTHAINATSLDDALERVSPPTRRPAWTASSSWAFGRRRICRPRAPSRACPSCSAARRRRSRPTSSPATA